MTQYSENPQGPIKALTPQTHAVFWCGAIILFCATIVLFKAVLLPFVLGIAVAYLLNPVVNALGRWNVARGLAALIILLAFLVFVVASAAIFAPILYRELNTFVSDLPSYIAQLNDIVRPLTQYVELHLGTQTHVDMEALLKEHAGSAVQVANFIVNKLALGGQAVMDTLSVLIFMPIVAFFMMKEWPSVTRWVQDLMPRHAEGVIMLLLKEIDVKISGFIRGQLTVAAALGVIYAIALSIVGLKYGLLIGLLAGALSVIPMVGSVVGLLISVLVAWFQMGEISFVALVAGIFLVGQVVEGNVLTPKLVGDSVGLHPLWVFFSLLAGGALLGILGMFLAVPVAAVVGVLIAFAIQKYKASAYYLQADDGESEDTPKAEGGSA